MNYDPNAPQPPSGQPPYEQSPYGQPPYGGQQPPSAYGQPPYGGPQSSSPYGQPQYGGPPGQAPYGAPPYGSPEMVQPPPKKKSSLRWLWITLGIVGGLVILGCGGCAIAGAFGIGFLAKTVAAPITTVNSYYQAVENQNYTQAYSYLQIDTFTAGGQTITASPQAFTQLASGLDTARGKVTNYSIKNTNVTSDTATITVDVTRSGQAYTVTIQLRQVNGTWKIVQFDNI
jgi:hypothetical protein